MSDPVTNIQIEDVLSSIRRLVAEGEKTKRPEPEEAKEETQERLVLTPALRVTDKPVEKEPPMMLVPDAPMVEEQETDTFLSPSPDDEPTAFVAADDAAEPDATYDAAMPDEVLGDDVPFDRARLEESRIPFDRASLEATIAELEAAVTEQPDEWEPDGSDTDLEPTWARAGFPSDQPVEDAEITNESDDDAEEDEPVVAADDNNLVTSAHDELADLKEPWDDLIAEKAAAAVSASLADLAVETDEIPDTKESEAADAATFRHAAPQAAEPDHDEDYADDLRDDPAPVNDDTLAEYLTDDAVIDEAMLRQMVLDIVRQELQGKLGERITRNVRKLVRREIHRVLTSPDLD